MAQELKVIADFYDFMLWLMKRTDQFPRHHRYSLGTSMENRLQTVLALLPRAKFAKEKSGLLNDANLELDILRFQLRLAKDTSLKDGGNLRDDLHAGAKRGQFTCFPVSRHAAPPAPPWILGARRKSGAARRDGFPKFRINWRRFAPAWRQPEK